MEQDIRWKQRFHNFIEALTQLEEAVKLQNPNDLEKEGTIQRFEFTHELAWKLMKDFLEYEGITGIIGSRSATREAFNKELISNGEVWMKMIETRNRTVHTYLEEILKTEYRNIVEDYYPVLELFRQKMKSFL